MTTAVPDSDYVTWAAALLSGIGSDRKVTAEFLNKTSGETQTLRGVLKQTKFGWSLRHGLTTCYKLFPHVNIKILGIQAAADSQAPPGMDPVDDTEDDVPPLITGGQPPALAPSSGIQSADVATQPLPPFPTPATNTLQGTQRRPLQPPAEPDFQSRFEDGMSRIVSCLEQQQESIMTIFSLINTPQVPVIAPQHPTKNVSAPLALLGDADFARTFADSVNGDNRRKKSLCLDLLTAVHYDDIFFPFDGVRWVGDPDGWATAYLASRTLLLLQKGPEKTSVAWMTSLRAREDSLRQLLATAPADRLQWCNLYHASASLLADLASIVEGNFFNGGSKVMATFTAQKARGCFDTSLWWPKAEPKNEARRQSSL